MGWGLTICLWLGPPGFNYWFSFTLAYSRITHAYSSLFIIVINLILCFRFDALTESGAYMRTEFLCVSVLRVALGPRVKLASYKSALNPPTPHPLVYSTDCSKAVVLVLFLLFVLFFFSMCCDASIVVTVFNSCPLCFLFNSLCCDASIWVTFNSCPVLLSVFLFVIKSGIGTQGEVG